MICDLYLHALLTTVWRLTSLSLAFFFFWCTFFFFIFFSYFCAFCVCIHYMMSMIVAICCCCYLCTCIVKYNHFWYIHIIFILSNIERYGKLSGSPVDLHNASFFLLLMLKQQKLTPWRVRKERKREKSSTHKMK